MQLNLRLKHLRINNIVLVKLIVWPLFVAVLIYEAYSLYSFFNLINAQKDPDRNPRVSRIDFDSFNKAAARHRQASDYSPEQKAVPDPFSKPIRFGK